MAPGDTAKKQQFERYLGLIGRRVSYYSQGLLRDYSRNKGVDRCHFLFLTLIINMLPSVGTSMALTLTI